MRIAILQDHPNLDALEEEELSDLNEEAGDVAETAILKFFEEYD